MKDSTASRIPVLFLKLSVFLVAILSCSQLQARTWHVQPDGTGQAPTIRAAIDSASAGDVIELDCGTYNEYALEMKSGVTIRSATGQPDCATIDGQYHDYWGAIFQFWSVDSSASLEGLTITGGKSTDNYFGIHGGGLVLSGSAPVLLHCRITGNLAKWGGGMVLYNGSQPTLVGCEIVGNEAMFATGGVLVMTGSALTAYETIVGDNTAPSEPLDGDLLAGAAAFFHCCELDLSHWNLTGDYLIDDSDCNFVRTTIRSWGSLKAFYR